MYKFRQVFPEVPSFTVIHMFEELIFRVVLDVDHNLDPSHIRVQLWTNQRDRRSPEGDWHEVALPHRGEHSADCHVYGERSILVAVGEFQFLYRAKTDCERDWRVHPSDGEPGRFRVDAARCPEAFARSLRGPDASLIVGPLYLGNEAAAVNAARDCFTHVLCAAAELGQPFDEGAGVAFHKVPIRHGIENPIGDEMLCDAVNWLRKNWKQNRKILVYCKYGFSRAGSVVLAFVLDQRREMPYDEALQHLYNKRPVFPHAGLRDALLRLFPREPAD